MEELAVRRAVDIYSRATGSNKEDGEQSKAMMMMMMMMMMSKSKMERGGAKR